MLAARDLILDRTVALKVWLSPARERLAQGQEEAKKLARLEHPAIVRVHSAMIVQGRWCLAMELLSGETLRVWLQSTHDIDSRADVLEQILTAVEHAHAQEVVHGDLHAGNVMILESRELSGFRIKVIDFGTSVFAGRERAKRASEREVRGIEELAMQLIREDCELFPLERTLSPSWSHIMAREAARGRLHLGRSLRKFRYARIREDDHGERSSLIELGQALADAPFVQLLSVERALAAEGADAVDIVSFLAFFEANVRSAEEASPGGTDVRRMRPDEGIRADAYSAWSRARLAWPGAGDQGKF